MRDIILLVTVALIIVMVVKIYVRNSRYKNRTTSITDKGIRIPGYIVGVKPKNSFDHERNPRGKLIEMRIKHIDPHTSAEKIINYYASLGISGLHPYVLSASGYIDTGAIVGAFKAVRNYRKELINKGFQGAELKEAVKQYAFKISENPSHTTDETGYVVFDKTIPVNVYILPDDTTNDRKIHVEFTYDPKNNSDLYKVD